MNKKVNTLLFVLGATLMNIVLMVFLFIAMLAVLGLLFPNPDSASAAQFFVIAAFLVSLGGTYGIYSLLIKFFTKRIDMEKYFHPIFRPGKKR